MQPDVFLFDVDGVLVRPGGYRASVRATVNYFTNFLALGDLAPDDETIAIFEAQGITCEWDMVPALLALVINAVAARAPQGTLFPSLAAVRNWLAFHPLENLALDYPPALRRMGRFTRPGLAPSDCLLAACLDEQGQDLFPNIIGQGVLNELFSFTRHLGRSRTTTVFETFALGDAVLSRFTGLPAEVQSESLLARYDQPLLLPEMAARLVRLRSEDRVRFAAYTARPSQPSGKPEELLAVYAPEAEMALEKFGIEPFLLVGSGQTGEVARKLGENEERLIKPAPYHAVAAIAAAWTGDLPAALTWMEQIFCHFERENACGNTERPGLDFSAAPLPEHLRLHIFEDSPAGMRGGKHAVELLAEFGLHVDLHLWGVSDHPEKAAALETTGARVLPDINQALEAALQV